MNIVKRTVLNLKQTDEEAVKTFFAEEIEETSLEVELQKGNINLLIIAKAREITLTEREVTKAEKALEKSYEEFIPGMDRRDYWDNVNSAKKHQEIAKRQLKIVEEQQNNIEQEAKDILSQLEERLTIIKS
jgi:uncharacterized membrane protein YgaE (UPF0421/DUF939 family)